MGGELEWGRLMSERDADVLAYVVWVINKAAQAWEILPAEAYARMQRANIVDGYLIPCFDVLHSMGEQTVLEDVELIARREGVEL
jgi:hypothetical protein